MRSMFRAFGVNVCHNHTVVVDFIRGPHVLLLWLVSTQLDADTLPKRLLRDFHQFGAYIILGVKELGKDASPLNCDTYNTKHA